MIFGAELIVYILPKHIENFFIKFYFNKSQLFLVAPHFYMYVYMSVQNAWQKFLLFCQSKLRIFPPISRTPFSQMKNLRDVGCAA